MLVTYYSFQGNNAEFGYAIVGGDAKFGVSSNGDVYLDAILDREASQSHSFAVRILFVILNL